MAAAGKPLSHCKEIGSDVDTAYVNEGDLPEHLLACLSESWECIDIQQETSGGATESVTNTVEDCFGHHDHNNNDLVVDLGSEIADLLSSGRASPNCSVYEPGRTSPESLVEEKPYLPKVGSTDKEAMRQYYLVEGEQLLQLFRYCPQCGTEVSKAELKAVGTAPVVRFICPSCSLRAPYVCKWEGQKKAVEHAHEKMYKGNIEACVSLITTGLRFVELKRFADQLHMALFSDTYYWKIFELTKQAVDKVYNRHEDHVMDVIENNYQAGEGLHLAADGAYDSRGYSALIGKVVLSDTVTKLILRTEVLHRSETGTQILSSSHRLPQQSFIGGISQHMELEGIRRLFRWVASRGLTVASLTTDRSRSVGKLLRDMESEIGPIQHYYDGWHLVKWLGNELLKASKKRNCGPIIWWIEKLKTHCWNSIASGASLHIDIPPVFNTCLMHVQDVHEWQKVFLTLIFGKDSGVLHFQEDVTGPYNCCSHEQLTGPRPETLPLESDAYQNLRKVVLSNSFQRDLAKASPYGGTSICEAKNALDRLYCRKEIFYPISTYPLYVKMATMHINTLRLAELAGERNVIREVEVQRKYNRRKSIVKFKNAVPHKWRDEILQEVLQCRLLLLSGNRCEDILEISDDAREAMEAEEVYSAEL
ncbi:hypothetical protein OESDEN_19959 [Oesophagostomum dentatum]|uniref:Mutator-like transposase domain-containing protein n=1 Tax=Oesophagostomum dentatum TaxID=61180 RepID=A0A0B1S9Z7_OESDE|nr:hypothetical protein OESDEN_19959 [Oesophagostomum dentatum]